MRPAAALLVMLPPVALPAAVSPGFYSIVAAPRERADGEVRRLYEAWKSEHDRQRNDLGEHRRRLDVFRDNLRYVDAHNAEADAGLHGFRLGLTAYANGFRRHGNAIAAWVGSSRYLPRSGEELPDAVDWHERGAVAEVKSL